MVTDNMLSVLVLWVASISIITVITALPVDAATAPMSTGGIPNMGMRNAAA